MAKKKQDTAQDAVSDREKQLEAKAEAAEERAKRAEARAAKAEKPKGIPSKKPRVRKRLERPDEKMAKHLETSIGKKPEDLSEAEWISLERKIRRYTTPDKTLKNGKKLKGGYKKNLSEEDKAVCDELLARIGRKEPKWDKSIHVPGFSLME